MTKLDAFHTAEKQSRAAANRLLFTWLSDDDERADLYRRLLESSEVLNFQSRANIKERSTQHDSVFNQEVYLLAKKEHVERALTTPEEFSNSPYRVLGSGTFMLGLDDADHQKQRAFASEYLRYDETTIDALASVAFKAAAVLSSKQRKFDFVDVSEQVALHFVGFLFGFEEADHIFLEKWIRAAFLGLNHQIVGRHFVSEPAAIPDASSAMGALLRTVAQLIDLYRARIGQTEEDEFERIELELEELRREMGKSMGPRSREFEPVLRRIAKGTSADVKWDYSGNELAVIVVGLIAGTIGNIQAGASIAIYQFFRDCAVFKRARDAAIKWKQGGTDDVPLSAFIWEALRLNPPAAFLPRKTKQSMCLGSTDIPEGSNVILAIGAATRDASAHSNPDKFDETRTSNPDPLIFGGLKGANEFLHRCVGQHLAMPVIARIVREALLLDDLAETYDPRTGKLFRLEKLCGVVCQKYPLEFNRTAVLTQFPLIVVMKVKAPVAVHAEALKQIMKYGAPKIEKQLRDAGHIHFAWFMFIENDTKLMLATIYDRDFDSYIKHFASEIGGSMFDLVFEHIQDPPPMPVSKFPKEFMDAIRHYNNRTVEGYFFSAYPKPDVSRITHHYPYKYPLEFNRTDVLTQFPLIVVMKVKTPVAVHAETLKQIIKYGAPKIEKKLRDAAHVHFAWFMFIENDTKLMLATIYDRDFDSYIEYFALQIGSMFDLVFEHIQDPPPRPVNEFPKEFVDMIRHYNNPTAEGYFFSAYPTANVSMITHHYPPEDP
jgi:cytochrome P450